MFRRGYFFIVPGVIATSLLYHDNFAGESIFYFLVLQLLESAC